MNKYSLAFLAPPSWVTILLADIRWSWIWLLIRLYVGSQWLIAGYSKLISTNWIGEFAGSSLTGFLHITLAKTTGEHPDVSFLYAWFVQHVVLPHVTIFSYVITFGEILTGIGLILGCFTVFAALGGTFMNLNYLLAGTVSINPQLLILEILLIAAWRIAGFLGIDYWLSLKKRKNILHQL